MECSCCSQDRTDTVTLGFRDDVRLCPDCVSWLANTVGTTSTPTLPVRDLTTARAFFEAAGFEVRAYEGGGFAFCELNGQSVFDLDEITDMAVDANHAGCYIITPDVDELRERLANAGLPVSEVRDEPWGMREFTLTDPFKNNIRIGHTTPS
jgi:uncharacterized glyoxalase superfamily protein PhnB